MKKKRFKGFMTVEAAILIPFMVLVTFLAFYMVIFIYDKTLLMQDVNTLCAVGEANTRLSSTDLTSIIEDKFAEMVKEHPYISARDFNLKMKREGVNLRILVDYEYVVPIFSAFNRKVSFGKSIKTITPIYVLQTRRDFGGGISK
jgi:hypothetical protein